MDDDNDDERVRDYTKCVYVRREREETRKNATHWTFTWKKMRDEKRRENIKKKGNE